MSFESKELGQICEITSSKRIMRSEYVLNGIPFYRSKEIIEFSQGLSISTDLYISSEQYHKIKDKFGVPKIGDILLTSVGTLGISYQIDNETAFYFKDGNLTWFRNFHKDVQSKYVYVWLKSFDAQQKLKEISIGTTQKALTIQALKKVSLSIPSIDIQNKISKIYFDFNNKIHLNNQINQTLESIAQAIFKSWFIDFEPVRAKIAAKQEGKDPERAAMCAISGKSEAELEQMAKEDFAELQATAALFPDELIESELGEVPRGWGVSTVGDDVDTISKTYPLKQVKEIIFLNTGDILDGKFLHSEKSDVKTLPGQAKKSIQKGDILYSEIRPKNKRYAYVYFETPNYVVSTKLMVLRQKSKISSLFVYFILSQQSTIDFLQVMAESRSGTFPQITFDVLSKVEYLKPNNDDLINIFTRNILTSFFEKKVKNEMENQNLIEIRDTLLPKLLSGEIDIGEF